MKDIELAERLECLALGNPAITFTDKADLALAAARLRQIAPAEPVNPAPGYCKHCKQYTIEEPLPAAPAPEPPLYTISRGSDGRATVTTTPAPVLNSESVVQTGRAEVIPTGESSLRVRIPPLSDPAAPAPDAAAIMALADEYARFGDWEDGRPVEADDNERAALRAAVERVIAENERLQVDLDRRGRFLADKYAETDEQRQRAEKAEAERDALRAQLVGVKFTIRQWLNTDFFRYEAEEACDRISEALADSPK